MRKAKDDPDFDDFGRFSEPSLLILISLADGPKHGYAMTEDIASVAGVRLGPGTLYGAITRLEERGWIRAEWGDSENNRRAKFYHLTRAGRKQLGLGTTDWERLTSAIARILEST